MADFDLFKTALDAGMAFTQMTRDRAEVIVRDLVRTSELSREQTAAHVEDLIERSRKNTDILVAMVRKEIDDRLADLATRDDLAKLAARIGVTIPTRSTPARKAPAARKSSGAAKKAAAVKKAPVAKKAVPVKKAAKKA